MTRFTAFAGLLLVLGGCVVNAIPQELSTNPANGTVLMALTSEPGSTAVPDWVSAEGQASARCSTWGFAAATFSGRQDTSVLSNGYRQTVREYHCTR